ncbi:putative DNA-3-methyladenine glycosylase [Halotydeus destructor]|nr:putative DNA-3-methyladenine glycosylase [Halotydeus destructor]
MGGSEPPGGYEAQLMKRRSTVTELCANVSKRSARRKESIHEDISRNPIASPYSNRVCSLKFSRLGEAFYNVDSTVLAVNLIGKVLCRYIPETNRILKGCVIETEAYCGVEDRACHTFGGKRTQRNEPMFMKPGTAYVYFTYGMYHCFNISSKEEGGAVLIRAVEPLEGLEDMTMSRAKFSKFQTSYSIKNVCNGPSKMCIAYEIDKLRINKQCLFSSEQIWLEPGRDVGSENIASSKRIGLGKSAADWLDKPLRFFEKNSSFVSVRLKS